MRYKIVLALFVLLIMGGITKGWSQTEKVSIPPVDWTTGWAAGLKVSTLGPGIEAIKSINANWNARIGFSLLPFQVNKEIKIINLGMDISTKNRLGGINIQGDFFFRPWFYFTGGVLIDLVQSKVGIHLTDTVQYGDIDITPGQIGDLSARVRPGWIVAPFLALGLGNPMPLNHKLSFNVELGAIYHGKPDFKLEGVGMIVPTASAENEKTLETALKGYRFYPIFSLQLNYRIR